MELRGSVDVRSKMKGESKVQRTFDDSIVQLSDIPLPIYLFKMFSSAN
jgi:hypothetical protein